MPLLGRMSLQQHMWESLSLLLNLHYIQAVSEIRRISASLNLYSVPNNIRIVAVDPGVNLGVATIDFDLKEKKFKVKHAYTLDLGRYIPVDEDQDKRSMIMKRLTTVKEFIKSYLESWQPNYGAHETAYVPHGGGGASVYSYASLIENIICIKFAFIESSSDIKVFEINPTTVKMSTVGYKSSDKTLILKALIADPMIDLSEIDVTRLNQHNADAIAIGITCIRENFNLHDISDETVFGFKGKTNGGKKPSRPKRRKK